MTEKSWIVKISEEAQKDYASLDGSFKPILIAGLRKASQNPLPKTEGGYGKPLGSHNKTKLTNFLKIKFKKQGIRIVYTLVKTDNVMNILVISIRDDNECYQMAQRMRENYGDDLFKDIFDKLKM